MELVELVREVAEARLRAARAEKRAAKREGRKPEREARLSASAIVREALEGHRAAMLAELKRNG